MAEISSAATDRQNSLCRRSFRSSKAYFDELDSPNRSSFRRSIPLRHTSMPGHHHSKWSELATICITGSGSDGNGDFIISGNQERMLSEKSFFDPKQYDVALRRCDDGLDLTNALLKMVSERADIEQRHADNLQNWSSKWRSFLDKSVEYGTNKATWYSIVSSTESDVELHKEIRYRFHNDVISKLEQFKKEKYSKNLHRIRKTKDFEKEFESVQKPWLKQLAKVEAYKREYVMAARRSKQAESVEKTVHSDVGSTDDQRRRISEKVDILRKELTFTRERYRQSVTEANQVRERYVSNMEEVFGKCQQFERLRLDFFKEMFGAFTKAIMDIPPEDFKKSAKTSANAVAVHNSAKDLEWWSNTYALGTVGLAKWPVFEELNESINTAQEQQPHHHPPPHKSIRNHPANPANADDPVYTEIANEQQQQYDRQQYPPTSSNSNQQQQQRRPSTQTKPNNEREQNDGAEKKNWRRVRQ